METQNARSRGRLDDFLYIRLRSEERQRLELLAMQERKPLSTLARDLLLASLVPVQQERAEAT